MLQHPVIAISNHRNLIRKLTLLLREVPNCSGFQYDTSFEQFLQSSRLVLGIRYKRCHHFIQTTRRVLFEVLPCIFLASSVQSLILWRFAEPHVHEGDLQRCYRAKLQGNNVIWCDGTSTEDSGMKLTVTELSSRQVLTSRLTWPKLS